MTKLIQGTQGFIILRLNGEQVCNTKQKAVEALKELNIDQIEIDDAFAAMNVNSTNGAEFGVCGTFIRTFNNLN